MYARSLYSSAREIKERFFFPQSLADQIFTLVIALYAARYDNYISTNFLLNSSPLFLNLCKIFLFSELWRDGFKQEFRSPNKKTLI